MQTNKQILTSSTSALTFNKAEEVFNLPEFEKGRLININNYANIYAEYHTYGLDMNCCCQKKSKKGSRLCGSEHRHGFVIRLQCGTLSLLGSTCVTEFDIDAKIHKDHLMFKRQLERQHNEQRLNEFLNKKESLSIDLSSLEVRIKEFLTDLKEIKVVLGEEVSKKIQDKAKTKDPSVSVLGVRVKYYIDDEGKKQTETSKQNIIIAAIKGLEVFDKFKIQHIQKQVGDYKRALINGESMAQQSNFKGVEKLLNTLSNSPEKMNVQLSSLELASLKFKAENKTFLCYFTNKSSIRQRITQNHLKINQLPSTLKDATQYIVKERKVLLKEHKLTNIEVI